MKNVLAFLSIIGNVCHVIHQYEGARDINQLLHCIGFYSRVYLTPRQNKNKTNTSE